MTRQHGNATVPGTSFRAILSGLRLVRVGLLLGLIRGFLDRLGRPLSPFAYLDHFGDINEMILDPLATPCVSAPLRET